MTNQNHTPTPWAFGVYDATEYFKSIKQHSCVCDPVTLALIATCGKAEDKNSQADAEFICRAVNSHEELVKELGAIADALKAGDTVHIESGSVWAKRIADVLAKAEGK